MEKIRFDRQGKPAIYVRYRRETARENAAVRFSGTFVGREEHIQQATGAHFLQDRFGKGEQFPIMQVPVILRHTQKLYLTATEKRLASGLVSSTKHQAGDVIVLRSSTDKLIGRYHDIS